MKSTELRGKYLDHLSANRDRVRLRGAILASEVLKEAKGTESRKQVCHKKSVSSIKLQDRCQKSLRRHRY